MHLEANGACAAKDHALDERLRKARALSSLAHDDGPELCVVTDEDDLLCAECQRQQTLRLCRLRRLVDQHLQRDQRRLSGTERRRCAWTACRFARTRRAHLDVHAFNSLALAHGARALAAEPKTPTRAAQQQRGEDPYALELEAAQALVARADAGHAHDVGFSQRLGLCSALERMQAALGIERELSALRLHT